MCLALAIMAVFVVLAARRTQVRELVSGGADPQTIQELLDLEDRLVDEESATRLRRILVRLGVPQVSADVGDVFDPDIHKAVATSSVATAASANRIASVVRPGWLRDGEVVRPADVVVTVPND
jgi:molecular chaperone GrpE